MYVADVGADKGINQKLLLGISCLKKIKKYTLSESATPVLEILYIKFCIHVYFIKHEVLNAKQDRYTYVLLDLIGIYNCAE